MTGGIEWLIEAHGCDPAGLTSHERLQTMFDAIVEGLRLHPLGEPLWHQFRGSGGITGLWMLTESHLACHTFPEYGSLTLNIFSCVPRPDWDAASWLRLELHAARVYVRRIERCYANVLARS